MKNLLLSLVLVFGFIVLSTHNNTATVIATSDLVTGTDIACQKYWEQVNILLKDFKEIWILNQGWIPSKKVIRRVAS